MQRQDHRSITRIALQQVYPDLPDPVVKRIERSSSFSGGFGRQGRNPELFALKLPYAEEPESRELISLSLQELLLKMADASQLKQRKRVISSLGQVLHLLQEIGFSTGLIELGYEEQAAAVEELIRMKQLSGNISLYAVPGRGGNEAAGEALPAWDGKEADERRDLSLQLSIQFLKTQDRIMQYLSGTGQ